MIQSICSSPFLRFLEAKFAPLTSCSRRILRGTVVSIRGDTSCSRIYTIIRFQTKGLREPRARNVRNSLGEENLSSIPQVSMGAP